jgi:hypothetical protein
MTESYPTPRAVTLVAVDIAKSCHDVLIGRPHPLDADGFAWLIRWKSTNGWLSICTG